MRPLKPINEQVIVITGASSGIGLATAKMAAEAGASLVLGARNEDALAETCREIEAKGGKASYTALDVGDAAAVERLAKTAIDRFGRIDTWVNNAGVDLWGEVLDVSNDDARRLFETNLWGVVYGSRTAVEHLRSAGGALITVASVASDRAFPLQGVYCASKHAVKAWTEALRMELERANVPVSVALIKPSSIATPLAQQAKSYLDHDPKLPSPLYAPDEVARAILYAAQHPKRDIYVGSAGRILGILGAFAPRLTDIIGEKLLFEAQERPEKADDREDNLHHAGPKGGLTQEVPDGRSVRPSLSMRAATHPTATLVTLAAIGGALAWAALQTTLSSPRPPRH